MVEKVKQGQLTALLVRPKDVELYSLQIDSNKMLKHAFDRPLGCIIGTVVNTPEALNNFSSLDRQTLLDRQFTPVNKPLFPMVETFNKKDPAELNTPGSFPNDSIYLVFHFVSRNPNDTPFSRLLLSSPLLSTQCTPSPPVTPFSNPRKWNHSNPSNQP